MGAIFAKLSQRHSSICHITRGFTTCDMTYMYLCLCKSFSKIVPIPKNYILNVLISLLDCTADLCCISIVVQWVEIITEGSLLFAYTKGPSINYVVSKSAIFDPLPPIPPTYLHLVFSIL